MPFELYRGKMLSVKHLRFFGSTVYVGIPKYNSRKMDMRAEKGVLVEYALFTNGYRAQIPEKDQVIETINVRIEEFVKNKEVFVQSLVHLDALDLNDSEVSDIEKLFV